MQLLYLFSNKFLKEKVFLNKPLGAVPHTVVSNSLVDNNTSPYTGGAISAIIESQDIAAVIIRFVNTTFSRNVALQYGDCMFLQSYYSSFFQSKEINVYLDSVKIFDNGIHRPTKDYTSSCVFAAGLSKLVITGSDSNEAIFSGHRTSAVRAVNSHVYLNGSVNFINNQGLKEVHFVYQITPICSLSTDPTSHFTTTLLRNTEAPFILTL